MVERNVSSIDPTPSNQEYRLSKVSFELHRCTDLNSAKRHAALVAPRREKNPSRIIGFYQDYVLVKLGLGLRILSSSSAALITL